MQARRRRVAQTHPHRALRAVGEVGDVESRSGRHAHGPQAVRQAAVVEQRARRDVDRARIAEGDVRGDGVGTGDGEIQRPGIDQGGHTGEVVDGRGVGGGEGEGGAGGVGEGVGATGGEAEEEGVIAADGERALVEPVAAGDDGEVADAAGEVDGGRALGGERAGAGEGGGAGDVEGARDRHGRGAREGAAAQERGWAASRDRWC